MKNNKPTCENHATEIEGYEGKLDLLAEHIGDLRYKELAEFLRSLAFKLDGDAYADYEAGRIKMFDVLTQAAKHITIAEGHIDNAWRISKPYMKDDE